MKAIWVCGVLLSVTPSIAAAHDRITGRELLKFGEFRDLHSGLASQYIRGIVDYEISLATWLGRKTDFCLPETIGIRELEDSVMRYLRRNPERQSDVAAEAVVDAFASEFPCKP
jgi:Rap1a immunity proteins